MANPGVAGQGEFRRGSLKIGRPATEIGPRRQKASRASEKMRTRDAKSSHLQHHAPTSTTPGRQIAFSGVKPASCAFHMDWRQKGNRVAPEGIDKKGSVRGPCAESGDRAGDGRPMTSVIRPSGIGSGHDGVCLTTVTGRSARKREELAVKRPGEPLFWLLTEGVTLFPFAAKLVHLSGKAQKGLVLSDKSSIFIESKRRATE